MRVRFVHTTLTVLLYLQLEVGQPLLLRVYINKMDMEEPPPFEDGSSYGSKRTKHETERDPFNLEERFYRYGIKPEWLMIHRIINVR